MQIPDGHAGEKWVDALGWFQGEVTIGDDVGSSLSLSSALKNSPLASRRDGPTSSATLRAFQSGSTRMLLSLRSSKNEQPTTSQLTNV